jgi:hypothetical protein
LKKLKFLLSRCVGLASRTVMHTIMRTGSLMLRPRARLEALSAAIEWFVKRNDHKPLEITHESDHGDVHLMSDGKRIQLTWWIRDRDPPDTTAPTDRGDCGQALAMAKGMATGMATTTATATATATATPPNT